MITKIQSESDIITNSSSEVFIILEEDAERIDRRYNGGYGCISWETIDEHFLETHKWDIKLIYEALDEPFPYPKYGMTDNQWRSAIDHILPKFQEVFGKNRYVLLDIEDHFSACEDAYEDAHDTCLWYDYRH